MNKLRCFIMFFLIGQIHIVFGQSDLYEDLFVAIKKPDEFKFIRMAGDSSSTDTLNAYIGKLGHIAGIAIEGKVENSKSLWQSMYQLRLLEQIIFINNDLKQIQLGGSSSTIKELWITGSEKISAVNLNTILTQTKYLQVLRINGLRENEVPNSFNGLKYLTKVQYTNGNLNFNDLAASFRDCESLSYLDLSDNNFQITGRGMRHFENLSYLDLSGNELITLPPKLKNLQLLDTLILNRNIISDIETDAQELQKHPLRFLALDEDSLTIQERVEYNLPGKKIVWSPKQFTKNDFELPKGNYRASINNVIDSISFKNKQDVLEGAGEVKLLSPAYLTYDQLYFPNPLKDFDTSTFATRYLNPDYIYTDKIRSQNHTEGGSFYPLKYDKAHHSWYKKKRLKKLNHQIHSYVRITIIKPPKELDGTVLFSMDVNTFIAKRTDLQAYNRIVWEAIGYVSKKEFQEDLIKRKAWSDFRILYDEQKDEFQIELKGRFYNKSVLVKPRKSTNPLDEKDLQKSCAKMAIRYDKALSRNEKKFNRDLVKDHDRTLRPDSREINRLWALVEEKMSKEEKELSKEDWLIYYQGLKKNEFPLLEKEKMAIPYISRYLESQHFTRAVGFDFYVGQQWVDFKFINCDSSKLIIEDFCLIDLDRKVVKYYDADSNTQFLFEPFHQYLLIAQLEDNRIVYLNNKKLLAMKDAGEIILEQNHFVNNEITTGDFFKNYILKTLNNLNY